MNQSLLVAGADPSWRNAAGNSVLNLYGKRDQVAMAEAAHQALRDPDSQRAFVNQTSKSGMTINNSGTPRDRGRSAIKTSKSVTTNDK